MASIAEQLSQLRRDLIATRATALGYRPDAIQWLATGNIVICGYFVQVHTDKTTIRIHDGTADSPYPDEDSIHRNANKDEALFAQGHWAFAPNGAMVGGYGHVSSESFKTLDDTGWPSATYSRYDIVYLYFASDGTTSIGIAEGASTTGTPADPEIPVGAMGISRLTIDDTGITAATDIRAFAAGFDQGLLDAKADVTYVDTELTDKADVTYVDTELADKADVTINVRGYSQTVGDTTTLYLTTDGTDPTP